MPVCTRCHKDQDDTEFINVQTGKSAKTCNNCRIKRRAQSNARKKRLRDSAKNGKRTCFRCRKTKDESDFVGKDGQPTENCCDCLKMMSEKYQERAEKKEEYKKMLKQIEFPDDKMSCNHCLEIKDKEEFAYETKIGTQYYNNCKNCRTIYAKGSRKKIQKKRERNVEVPENHQECTKCWKFKPNEEFINPQTGAPTMRCKDCRTQGSVYDARKHEKYQKNIVTEVLPEYQKRCSDCHWIKDINNDFHSPDAQMCKSCCEINAKYVRERRQYVLDNAHLSLDENICHYCLKIKPIDCFKNKQGKIINTCTDCINYGNESKKQLDKKRKQRYQELIVEETDDQKVCYTCLEFKPIDQFCHQYNDDIRTKNCLGCRQRFLEFQKKCNEKLRNFYIQLKRDLGKCNECGFSDHRAIIFSHIDPDKRNFYISKAPNIQKLEEEIKKVVCLCLICHTKKKIQGMIRRDTEQQNYVESIKKQIGGCQQCGWFDENYLSCLDFDHLDPKTKTSSISKMVWTFQPIPDIQQEIEKCQLLCKICHKLRTIEQFGWTCY